MSDTVIREVRYSLPGARHPHSLKPRVQQVAKDVWTFSRYVVGSHSALAGSRGRSSSRRPFARFGVFPVGGRSTAIRMRDGGVWVLASTPLDAETKEKLGELGPVK